MVAADPSAKSLHGCCGNACVSYYAWSLLGAFTCPFIGPLMVANTMLIPLQTRVAPPGAPVDGCCGWTCCGPCNLIQVMNEVELRQKAGLPVVPMQMMVMMTPPVVMNPMAAPAEAAPAAAPQ